MAFPKVTEFIQHATWPRNTWIHENGLHVYIRRSKRVIRSTYVECIDIANVHTSPRGKGVFTGFMGYLELLSINLYIENVHNERLHAWFDRRPGYKRDENDSTSFYYLSRGEAQQQQANDQ